MDNVIIVQQSLVHPFVIFPFQKRQECRYRNHNSNVRTCAYSGYMC